MFLVQFFLTVIVGRGRDRVRRHYREEDAREFNKEEEQ
jgi:hypothetical protein